MRLKFVSVAAGFRWATAMKSASTMLNCTVRAAPCSPPSGESSAATQSAKSDSFVSFEVKRLVMAITFAPFFRACRTASRTGRFCPEYEKATTTSSSCNKRSRHRHHGSIVEDRCPHADAQKFISRIPSHLCRAACAIKITLAGRAEALRGAFKALKKQR